MTRQQETDRHEGHDNGVFINCPFESSYTPLFHAIVFSIFDAGFLPRCTLECDDATEVRLAKILRIISQCRFSIHDISYAKLDPISGLPRFNMPLELGVFLGCKAFGGRPHRVKVGLVLDQEPFRYQKFISDLAGLDIRAHQNDPRLAIRAVRDWLRIATGRVDIPGADDIWQRYRKFQAALPKICRMRSIGPKDLTFVDYAEIVRYWLQETRLIRLPRRRKAPVLSHVQETTGLPPEATLESTTP